MTTISDKTIRDGHTDQEFIEAINAGGVEMERAALWFYNDIEFRDQIFAFVKKNGGSTEEAEDVLHDGIQGLILNIRAGKYQQSGSVKAYLATICKNIWRTQFNRRIQLNKIKTKIKSRIEHASPSPEHAYMWKEKSQLLTHVLDHLTASCKQVLGLWSLGYSFKEIGEKTNRNEGAARKQKHDCFKKLMLFLKNNPAVMDELKQLKTT